MPQDSSETPMPQTQRAAAVVRHLLYAGAIASTLWLGGCAVEVQNRQAAQEIAELSKPPGSVYLGWRVFRDKCSACHGPDATGPSAGPDLLPRVAELGPRRFVSLVLNRYDWNFPTAKLRGETAERESFVDEIVQRKEGALTMPAWDGEPRVAAHVADIYAYLSARAQGTQGVGRPAQ